MKEVVNVHLENEMDLILAGRRTMKLAELCGLSQTLQTALATAVSEIARCAMSMGKDTSLKLGITTVSPNKNQISAVICNASEACGNGDALTFARRLITKLVIIKKEYLCDIHLIQDLKYGGLIPETKIESFIDHFKSEPPLSPYDEIRRKNIQLLEFSAKLKESENQYRELSETLPLMVFVANPEGTITYTNQWFKNYLGTSLTTIVPSSGQTVLHPDDYVTLQRDLKTIFKEGNSFRAQGRLRHQDSGTYLWHLISMLPVKNENNAITQWTCFFVDIHAQKIVEETLLDNNELKEAKKNLIDYQRQLEEKVSELSISNNELEQFAYIASHDLQEPLRKIATFSTLLESSLPDLNTTSRSYFDKIISSSDQMADQIKAVLDWSRIAQTKEEFSIVDLNVIVGDVKSDFEVLIKEKQASIQVSPLPQVSGNRLELIQLFSNLISNALKFCDTLPAVNICSRMLSTDEIELNKKLNGSVNHAAITISDNGIGFIPAYSEQIFRIFQRLHNNSHYDGTGIGLAICKKIVEGHNGEIFATGSPGKGATFTIILPCLPALKNNSFENIC